MRKALLKALASELISYINSYTGVSTFAIIEESENESSIYNVIIEGKIDDNLRFNIDCFFESAGVNTREYILSSAK